MRHFGRCAVESGHAHRDVDPQVLRQGFEHFAGFLSLQVNQHEGDGLRVFGAEKVHQPFRLGLFERRKIGAAAAARFFWQPLDHLAGNLLAKRGGENAPRASQPAAHVAGAVAAAAHKLFQHGFGLLGSDIAQRRDSFADLPHLLVGQQLQQLGALLVSQAQQQDRALDRPGGGFLLLDGGGAHC
jgi:hypothetical protein